MLKRWGHDFTRNKEGELFNLEPLGKLQMSKVKPIEWSTTPFCLLCQVTSRLVEKVISLGWGRYGGQIRIWEVTHFWKVCFWLVGQVNAWEGMPKPLCTHAFHFLTHSIHVESLASSRRRTELSPSRLDVVSPFRHAQKLVWGFAEWMCSKDGWFGGF